MKTRYQTLFLYFLSLSIIQVTQFLVRYMNWKLISEDLLFILLATLSSFFWLYVLNNKVWERFYKALLWVFFATVMSSITSYLISFFLLGGSISGVINDNLGQMVHIFYLFIYLGIVLFTCLVTYLYLKFFSSTSPSL